MELSMGMTSRVEVEEDSDNNKGSMWDLDQKLDQPMDEEAGRLRNTYREKKFSALLLLRLAFQSLGVVYGDLGTSPLYVFYNTFPHGIKDPEDVIGALSLIIYSITLIPLLKYVFIVCRANDNGQGGTFALYSLLCRHANVRTIPNQHRTDEELTTYSRSTFHAQSFAAKTKRWLERYAFRRNALLILVLVGTCMVIGDGILTPAISVLSASGGIKVNQPKLSNDVVTVVAVVILVGLFSMQHYGTDKVGWLFAPIVLLWFLLIGGIGLFNIWKYDTSVLKAFSPVYIYRYLRRGGRDGWTSLGGIMLSITGIEALFADLAHFPVLAVQIAFTVVVFPCLLLAYSGQAAYLMQNKEHVFDAFYRSIPDSIYWPVFIVDTTASLEVERAVDLLRNAERPLIVFGKGAAYARAENELKRLVESTGIPFLPTPMGKGLLPDTHELAASAARSLAIGKCDVALVVGARLNWLLHFGEPPKWSKDVKFILVDVSEEEIELRKPHLGLVGDAKKVLELVNKEIKEDPFCLGKNHPWLEAISKKARDNVSRMEAQLAKDVVPFNFLTPMRIIRNAILEVGSPAPVLVSEGANTMDVGRAVLVQTEPRTRLDAGTWGTMGVGLGYCIAAAVAEPHRLVVAVEGDSGFGFSAMEVETLVRYQLPVVVIVFNNGGVYGGDRRNLEEITGPFKDDPAPTSFVPGAAYHVLIEAFGGKGYLVGTPDELKSALSESFTARKPAVINVTIDPYAGAESGRMQHKN